MFRWMFAKLRWDNQTFHSVKSIDSHFVYGSFALKIFLSLKKGKDPWNTGAFPLADDSEILPDEHKLTSLQHCLMKSHSWEGKWQLGICGMHHPLAVSLVCGWVFSSFYHHCLMASGVGMVRHYLTLPFQEELNCCGFCLTASCRFAGWARGAFTPLVWLLAVDRRELILGPFSTGTPSPLSVPKKYPGTHCPAICHKVGIGRSHFSAISAASVSRSCWFSISAADDRANKKGNTS